MKKHLYLAIFLSFTINIVFSQNFISGVIWDDEWYDNIEKENFDNYSFEGLPNYKSLKKYTPKVNNQGKLPSCVSQSIGYSCLTTMWAIHNNIQNSDVITKHAYSALYLFNNYVQTKSNDCGKGMSYSYAFNLLLNDGDILFKYFENNDTDNCNLNTFNKNTFERKRIKNYKRVFNIKDNKEVKVETTKYYINNNIPVIAGFIVTKEMNNNIIKKNNYYYKPEIFSTTEGGHSMLIVGFDDDKMRFEIMNSWGDNWGHNGFMYISYLDFATYCKYGFIMNLN